MGRPKKLKERERYVVALRYANHRRNRVKNICAEHGIGETTLRACVREFRGRI